MAVPQLYRAEVVEKTLVAVGPQIEERVRQELRELLNSQQEHDKSCSG
jgi:hypothetical protein